MIEILGLPLLAGLVIAVMAGPVGCVIVWRRMAYFGDAISHSALLGVALGLIIGLSTGVSIIMVCLLFAALMVLMKKHSNLQEDALLAVLAHGLLALGLVVWNLLGNSQIDLFAYLFGDILAVNGVDILLTLATALVVVTIMLKQWRSLQLMSIDEDIALVEGVNVSRLSLIFMLVIALQVAVTVKVVGVLLTTALLIIPAATARMTASEPNSMAMHSILFGIVSVTVGIAASWVFDLVIGPTIVLVSSIIFVVMLYIKGVTGRK